MRLPQSHLIRYGLPTILFSFTGLYALTTFIEGNNESRALTRLTTKSEREDRIQREQETLRKKVEGIREKNEKSGGYSFGKRIARPGE